MSSKYLAWKGMKTGDFVWACKVSLKGYNLMTMKPTKGILSTGDRCPCSHGMRPSPIGAEIKEFIPVKESGEIDWNESFPVDDLILENSEERCKRLYLNQLDSVQQNLLHVVKTLNTLKEQAMEVN